MSVFVYVVVVVVRSHLESCIFLNRGCCSNVRRTEETHRQCRRRRRCSRQQTSSSARVRLNCLVVALCRCSVESSKLIGMHRTECISNRPIEWPATKHRRKIDLAHYSFRLGRSSVSWPSIERIQIDRGQIETSDGGGGQPRSIDRNHIIDDTRESEMIV